MERVNKFRGKTEEEGEWVYGHFTRRSTKGMLENLIVCERTKKMRKIVPSTVGQFTGYKDSEGIEIFEGDYIRMQMMGVHCILKVSVKNGCFVMGDSYKGMHEYVSNRSCSARVIGSIHD